MTSKVITFNRLLPVGGITIYPRMHYVDANDLSEEERERIRTFFINDSEYNNVRPEPFGKDMNRAYSVYCYMDGECVGNMIHLEYLHTPWQFGKDDFYSIKRVYPKFRHTKFSRYISGDVIHMMFMSGIAKNLYSLLLAREGGDISKLWDAIDAGNPCIGALYPSDGPDTQKYMRIVGVYGKHVLVMFDGDIYRTMDLREYMMRAPNRSIAVVERWLEELSNAVQRIKETVCTR